MKTKQFFYNLFKKIVNTKNVKIAFVTLSFLLSMLFNKTFAQMSINTTGAEAHPSAGLDIDFSNKGLLIPRVALTSKNDATTIPNPATGLMVYHTGTVGLSLAGYYYNAGTSSSPNWVHLSTTGLDGSGIATRVAFWSGTNTISSNANLYWDNTNSRLGIGVTSPGSKLEICQNMSDYTTAFTGAHLNLGASNTVDNTGFVGITFDASTSANYGWSSGALRSAGGLSDFVWKHHNNNASGTELMRITSSGNVGIGTASPTQKLHVAGNIRATSLASGANGAIVKTNTNGDMALTNFTGSASDVLLGNGTFGSAITSGTAWQLTGNSAAAANFIGTTNAIDFRIYTNNAERMTVEANGNVGIGTTAPTAKLEINGNVLATAFKGTGNYQTVWGSWGNSIWLEKNATDGIFYNDPASNKGFMIGFHGSNDKIYIGHTTDGWSNGSYLGIIDGEGRVGIRTDPNNSYRLYVNGNGSTTAVRGIYNANKFGDLGSEYYGVYGQANSNIWGYLGGSNGAYGQYSSTRYGALGHPSYGVFGRYDDNIYGYIGGASYAVYGTGGTYAGYFNGNVRVTGTLTKGGGSFLIDHPLDPLNKTLRHNFVESPENLCLYRGKVKLDGNGEAVVRMPDYFAALTKEKEATVSPTPVGKPFMVGYEWNKDFTTFILYGEPNREVTYIVLADRDDPVIHELYKPVEEEKGNGNFTKGKLLYPKAYGYPEQMGVDYDEKLANKETN